jgi:hypothetical protein
MHMSEKMGHILAVIGFVVFGLYGFLLLPEESSAVSSLTVGTLAMGVVPVGAQADLESLSFDYEGAGTMKLSGAIVVVNDVAIYTLPETVLKSGDKITLCSSTNASVGCIPAWAGEVFPDALGAVKLQGTNGGDMALISYENPDNSALIRGTFERAEMVYGERDQVELCHTKDGVSFRLAKDLALKLMSGKGHGTDALDVIPPFFYRFDGGVNYYAGANWETGVAKFVAGCK